MSEENNNEELLAVLDSTVAEIVEKFPDYTDEELNLLKFAEEAGNTRSSLIKAIVAEHNQRTADQVAALEAEQPQRTADQVAALEAEQPQRTADEINADIEALEAQTIDIRSANQIHALRAELTEIVASDGDA